MSASIEEIQQCKEIHARIHGKVPRQYVDVVQRRIKALKLEPRSDMRIINTRNLRVYDLAVMKLLEQIVKESQQEINQIK